VDRGEIEQRARAKFLVRSELERRERLLAELGELEAGAGPLRRLAAALAGSRLAGVSAGDRKLGARSRTATERHAAELRRRRFRLTRRKRVLKRGASGRETAAGAGFAPLRERGEPGCLSFCIRIAAPDWESASRGGDAALARSLARALARRGHEAIVQVGQEAGDPLAEGMDVLLALRGRALSAPTPGRLNLIWQISHPDESSAAELERYDRVLVASREHAAVLAKELSTPVEPLAQFTDSGLFRPAPQPEVAHELLFVGNWRGEFRRIVWDAIQAGRPPALYGEGWDLLAPEHAVAEHVPHDDLRRLYSSCEILLCDHWEDMRRHGFVSNRVFDALACGACVLADDNPGIAAELPGAVETYSTQDELRERIDALLSDRARRERLASRGRELVLAEHTADRRAERLVAIATEAARAGAGSAATAGRP
jgi:glycosyltransferase involved in cell wall biosynthesis